MIELNKVKIAVIGLGYVGLPLAVEFGKLQVTVGYDLDLNRISDLKQGNDVTGEVKSDELKSAKLLTLTSKEKALNACNFYIVTVPTPVDENNTPDLSHILAATELVARFLKSSDIIVYESTVFPGATEDICVPVLEKTSGLVFNKDFFCGYSSERINPGDKDRKLKDIVKVTSGSTKKIAHIFGRY